MSSLIFYTDPQQALVATDTLAVGIDGAPFMFTSKAIYVPHLRTIIAGTGAGGFSGDWCMTVNNRMLLRGIENLDFHAPCGLRTLWKSYRAQYSLPDDLSTTVYHIGVSETLGEIVAFAYRSSADFASERLEHGVRVKPECHVPEGILFEHLREMMEEQRQLQQRKDPAERLYIGGEAIAIYLTKDSCSISPAFAFPDFDEQSSAAFQSFHGDAR